MTRKVQLFGWKFLDLQIIAVDRQESNIRLLKDVLVNVTNSLNKMCFIWTWCSHNRRFFEHATSDNMLFEMVKS